MFLLAVLLGLGVRMLPGVCISGFVGFGCLDFVVFVGSCFCILGSGFSGVEFMVARFLVYLAVGYLCLPVVGLV